MFVCIERWENKYDEENQKIWRYYTAKIIGMGTVYFLNIHFNLLGKTVQDLFGGNATIAAILPFRMNLGCPGLSTKVTTLAAGATLIDETNYSTCAEDEVGMNLLLIVS